MMFPETVHFSGRVVHFQRNLIWNVLIFFLEKIKTIIGVCIKTPTGLGIQFQEDLLVFEGMHVNGTCFYLDLVYDGEKS